MKTLRLLLAAMGSLLLVLLFSRFAVQQPASTGISIPMMRLRAMPLSNCAFNGFTVYLRSDGRLAGGSWGDVVSKGTILTRIKEARGNIQDATIFVVADPDVSFGRFAELVSDIHTVAPPDHIGVVTPDAQVRMFDHVVADRCRFEWPALKDQPKWPAR